MWYASVLLALLVCEETEAAIRSNSPPKFYGKYKSTATSDRTEVAPGEFPFFAQWGGCAATLIWEDILLTSAAVSTIGIAFWINQMVW